MKSTSLNIDGIGTVLLERSKRAKRLNISIRPFKGVRIAVPRGVSFDYAEKILYEKLDWVRSRIIKIKQWEMNYRENRNNHTVINKTKARTIILKRLNELSEMYGFTYNRIFVRNQKTRWGSCSSKNNININMSVIKLPGELMDYVLLHELVHTRLKNHSKDFWQELNKYVGNAKWFDKQLKKYALEL